MAEVGVAHVFCLRVFFGVRSGLPLSQGEVMLYTRRDLGKLALAGVPAAGILLKSDAGIAAGKPNSKWAGVQVGLNVPYSFGNNMMTGDETLDRCLQLGVSAVELRSQPVEQFLGVPVALITPRGRGTPPPDP